METFDDPAVRPRARVWRAAARALNWLDGKSNPYSPALCVSMILFVGLIVKLGPGLHAVLAHN